ncbi:MAG TPA: AAA family ATPase, partial [Candidatus Saccharimonadales bacterium]|nr:AAA family ATPase [Candidatus Saccharimonadales bacterium]
MTPTTENRSKRRIVVGLTGPNAAGKGEAARYLVSLGFTYQSLSDIIREEAAYRKMAPTRENLIRLGNELRRAGGPGVLAERARERLTGRDVVDSIRNPSEVEALRADPDFILLMVDAPLEVRYERARKRGRPGDGASLEEFAAREDREKSRDPLDQQIHRTMEMADARVDNSAGLDRLHRELDAFLARR